MKIKEFVWDYNMYGDPKMCGVYMAKKMYHHMAIRWPPTGELVINEYQYLVY